MRREHTAPRGAPHHQPGPARISRDHQPGSEPQLTPGGVVDLHIWQAVFSLMAALAFMVPRDDVGTRLSVSLTLVVTAATYKFAIGQQLPEIAYLTLLDRYIITTSGAPPLRHRLRHEARGSWRPFPTPAAAARLPSPVMARPRPPSPLLRAIAR